MNPLNIWRGWHKGESDHRSHKRCECEDKQDYPAKTNYESGLPIRDTDQWVLDRCKKCSGGYIAYNLNWKPTPEAVYNYWNH